MVVVVGVVKLELKLMLLMLLFLLLAALSCQTVSLGRPLLPSVPSSGADDADVGLAWSSRDPDSTSFPPLEVLWRHKNGEGVGDEG